MELIEILENTNDKYIGISNEIYDLFTEFISKIDLDKLTGYRIIIEDNLWEVKKMDKETITVTDLDESDFSTVYYTCDLSIDEMMKLMRYYVGNFVK